VGNGVERGIGGVVFAEKEGQTKGKHTRSNRKNGHWRGVWVLARNDSGIEIEEGPLSFLKKGLKSKQNGEQHE